MQQRVPSGFMLDPLIPYDTIITLYGPTSHAKSFLALSWAYHLALGRPWFGSAVARTAVAFLETHGLTNQRSRLLVLDQFLGVTDQERRKAGLLLLEDHPLRGLERHFDKKIDHYLALLTREMMGRGPFGIVVDSVNLFPDQRWLGNPQDAVIIGAELQRLKQESGASFLLLLYSQADRNASGIEALERLSDIVYRLEKSDEQRSADVPLILTEEKRADERVPVSTPLYLQKACFGSVESCLVTRNER